jgi:hypothetical protein
MYNPSVVETKTKLLFSMDLMKNIFLVSALLFALNIVVISFASQEV